MANILVIGGAGGVGRVVVNKLMSRGDMVITTVRDASEAALASARHGEKLAVHKVDLSDADAALVKLRDVVASIGSLAAVAVCAGIWSTGPIEITPLASFRRSLEINCLANVAIYQAALLALRESKGRIVYISSAAGKIGMPFVGAYTASKYALEGVGDVMRRESAPQGVKISIIEPGGIRTGMLIDELPEFERRRAELSEEDRARYGYLYRHFEAGVSESLAASASSPEQVAKIVVEALDAIEPKARYVVGEDAKQLLSMSSIMSDHELDGVVYRQMR